ncbi:hypothetical protein BDN72DRAFT_684002 [Pluteus cervinus]|uniref:Uncharacterized protein n=1 Tax=Pluteus cervinus TaxID=181527 RepID=A0ACD3A055_9AGAR|nr:hypothetical protein BDN72DRAFT_684002 [Pluteus cervinus]
MLHVIPAPPEISKQGKHTADIITFRRTLDSGRIYKAASYPHQQPSLMNDQSRNASPSSRPPSRAHQVIDMKAADSMEAAELVEDAETLQEPISSVRDGSNPWEKCIKLSKKYDDELCDALKGELDNLMLFATLFSAIVTAFTIDSYKWLEPDSGSSLTMPVAVQVNVLWFLSLASSLGVASTGILCMQWVRHYGLQEPKPTADSLAQRRQRYNGFRKWRVRDIISLLPVLLQLALVLFGIGLIRFLWALDHTVGVGFMVVSVITIAFVLVTMFAPILQWWFLHLPWSWLKTTQCPFQSPQAWIFYSISWWLAAPVRDPKKFESDPGNWRTFDESWLEWHAGPIKSKSSKDKKGDDPKNYADNPLVDVSYKVKLICEELIWLDDMFSDNLEGIKARAEALGRLPFKAAKYVVRNKLNSYARRHVRQRRTSEPGPEQPEQPDIKELFKLLTPFDQIGRLSSPDQAVGDEDRRHDRDFKHLRAWYLWAHAQDHLGLDDAYMESRIQFMSEVPRDHILLPALPRSSHLDVYCLVKTKEGSLPTHKFYNGPRPNRSIQVERMIRSSLASSSV